MRNFLLVLGLGLFVGIPTAQASTFQYLDTMSGAGVSLNQLVATTSGNQQKIYLSFSTNRSTSYHLLEIDPNTGASQTYLGPTVGEWAAWGMTVGKDGNIYLGTFGDNGAHLFRFDPRTKTHVDLGKSIPGQGGLWTLATAPDGKIYGGTSFGAKMFRYDPATGKFEYLGQPDPKQTHLSSILIEGDKIYLGMGYTKGDILVGNINNLGVWKSILPPEYQEAETAPGIYKYPNGKIYAKWQGKAYMAMEINGDSVTPVAFDQLPLYTQNNVLADGRIIFFDSRLMPPDPNDHNDTTGLNLQVISASGQQSYLPFSYAGAPISIWRLGKGPENQIYASGVQPAYLMRLENNKLINLGSTGRGETFTYLNLADKRLLLGNYALHAPIEIYDPKQPWKFQWGASGNPRLIVYPGYDARWRPWTGVVYSDRIAYLAGVLGKGQMGGPLAEIDYKKYIVNQYFPVFQQSIHSIIKYNNLLIGGTSIRGGDGTTPTTKESKLFIWDPVTKKTVFETVLVPGSIDTRGVILVNSLIYGVTDKAFFVFDPIKRALVKQTPLPFAGPPIVDTLVTDPAGKIWGLVATGLFQIDPLTQTIQLKDTAPKSISGGIVIDGWNIYFAADTQLYKYTITH